MERHSSSDGDTYSVDITFAYEFQGRKYQGGSYDFNDVSSSGYSGKAEVVRRFPVGADRQCWVNPADPEVAVLSRKVPGIVYFIIPFSSVFMLVGLGCMFVALGLLPKSWQKRMLSSGHTPVITEDLGQIKLTAEGGGRGGKFIGMLFVCLFWNSIVGMFVWKVVSGFMDGNPEWGLVVFLIPFVVIGLSIVGAVFYYLLALFNPQPIVSLDEGSPRLGDKVNMLWQFTGSVKRLHKLQITLEGHEHATYRRGTDTVTDKSLFYQEYLVEAVEFQTIATGRIHFTIPSDLMHSFASDNNKIVWSLSVQGHIKGWPNVNDRYPVTIRPLILKNDF